MTWLILIISGDKKFLMGDQPTELDCAAFGILSQIRWNCPDACPGKTLINGTLVVILDPGLTDWSLTEIQR